jgi:prolipoprotein diacylglyceryltransferase
MAFINFTIEGELIQALSMTLVVLGAVFAIFLYNKGAEQTKEHH